MQKQKTDIAIIGAGIAGIATAYYLSPHIANLTLIDRGDSMAFTSAQSGENYRNWWPHPIMTQFTDDSIDLIERLAHDSDNRLQMTRRGYALATRAENTNALINSLYEGYASQADSLIRIHQGASDSYQPAHSADWTKVPTGVDVIQDDRLLRETFPYYDPAVTTVLHIRRAGDISGQQMGQYMLEQAKERGLQRMSGQVVSIEHGQDFTIEIVEQGESRTLQADRLVNAAGPFINDIAGMLGTSLPVNNVLHQKIAFADNARTIRRDMPFSIDLDAQLIDWSDEERALLAEDEDVAWLTNTMPGGIHCRPDGGEQGSWIKLGWAYNTTPTHAHWNPELHEHFPDIVLRGAARLNPALKNYYGRLPRQLSHYGGYYTMTKENWPLIGPMDVSGAYIVGALSGFGTMAACAAGSLCAAMITGASLPSYANNLGLGRYRNATLMEELSSLNSQGIL